MRKAEEKIYSFKPKIYPRRKAKKKSPVVKTELSSEELVSLTECTGYSEEEIEAWFSQFQTVCPGGVLRRTQGQTSHTLVPTLLLLIRWSRCLKISANPSLPTSWITY